MLQHQSGATDQFIIDDCTHSRQLFSAKGNCTRADTSNFHSTQETQQMRWVQLINLCQTIQFKKSVTQTKSKEKKKPALGVEPRISSSVGLRVSTAPCGQV